MDQKVLGSKPNKSSWLIENVGMAGVCRLGDGCRKATVVVVGGCRKGTLVVVGGVPGGVVSGWRLDGCRKVVVGGRV